MLLLKIILMRNLTERSFKIRKHFTSLHTFCAFSLKKNFVWSIKMASSSAQQTAALQMVADLEIEMMTDMYRRMTKSCQEKCVDTHYREPDLSKGESVCLDRCVSKYLDVHDRLGKLLTQMTQQDDRAVQQQQQNLAAAAQKMHGK